MPARVLCALEERIAHVPPWRTCTSPGNNVLVDQMVHKHLNMGIVCIIQTTGQRKYIYQILMRIKFPCMCLGKRNQAFFVLFKLWLEYHPVPGQTVDISTVRGSAPQPYVHSCWMILLENFSLISWLLIGSTVTVLDRAAAKPPKTVTDNATTQRYPHSAWSAVEGIQ